MLQNNIRNAISEIFTAYNEKSFSDTFTLDSISTIFEIGSDILIKQDPTIFEKLMEQPPSNAPDIVDEQQHGFERYLQIYEALSPNHKKVTPDLISRIYELNSSLAWEVYKVKYKKYIYGMYEQHNDDEYINYLAAVLFYEEAKFHSALKCVNIALSHNGSSSLFTHLKGLCLMQMGEFEAARTYFYQALFLIELLQDTPPRLKGEPAIYPNYPIEYHTSADIVRSDLEQLDKADDFYHEKVQLLIESSLN